MATAAELDEGEDVQAWEEDDAGHDVPLIAKAHVTPPTQSPRSMIRSCSFCRSATGILLVLVFGLLAFYWPHFSSTSTATGCTSPNRGYHCHLPTAAQWGPYTPYSSVRSDILDSLPSQCEISFVQVLSRHGSRFPTSHKGAAYRQTIQQLQDNVESFPGKYSFLASYEYSLSDDDQTPFGQQELVDSGSKFYRRYSALARAQTPFFRASSSSRVVEAAQNFTQGFHGAKTTDPLSTPTESDKYPYDILIISEGPDSNNTLDHGVCKTFEDGRYDSIPASTNDHWQAIFVPPIQQRLNSDLPGADLSESQVVFLMDLCAFETVASDGASTLSRFCGLFTGLEWEQYSYLKSLDKYYNFGSGNPLGPSQGVGFTNELVARMTEQAVRDETSTNSTLDTNPDTFPLGHGQALYADFSHDTSMVSIFSAMGLYNATEPLLDSEMASPEESKGFAASWVVPFAARAYFEKIKCADEPEELVRVLVNDRVIPLQNCGADKLGRCPLGAWVQSLSFAEHNGHWSNCFLP